MSPFLNGVPQPRPMLGDFRTGAGTISLSWSCGVRVSLHKPVAESIRGSRPCKSARTGHPPVSVTLARSRATGSTPLGRLVFTTEAQSHREKMNERRSFGPNSPTQAKTGLEWATRLMQLLGAAPSRAQLVLAKERILECLVSLMRNVQNLSEFGFAVQSIQKRVFVDIGIAEETRFNASPQHM